MIDFKYYIVTVTAIFAALFAGLILGSSISTNEVVKAQQESLIKSIRSDLSKLRMELSSKEKELEELSEYVAKSKDWILAEKMNGKTIYIITFSDVKKPMEKEVIQTLQNAGGKTVSITIDLNSLKGKDTTFVSSLIELSYSPQISKDKIHNLIKEVGEVNGDVSQAQEVLILFDKESINYFKKDHNLKKFNILRTATSNKEAAEELFKEEINEDLVCTVYDGDVYDDVALILSFNVVKGIYGEPGYTGIIPEKGD